MGGGLANSSMLLQVGGSAYIPPEQTDPPSLGAGGTQIFRFRAIDTGSNTLKLVYKQPWGTEPANTFVLDIVITDR